MQPIGVCVCVFGADEITNNLTTTVDLLLFNLQ